MRKNRKRSSPRTVAVLDRKQLEAVSGGDEFQPHNEMPAAILVTDATARVPHVTEEGTKWDFTK